MLTMFGRYLALPLKSAFINDRYFNISFPQAAATGLYKSWLPYRSTPLASGSYSFRLDGFCLNRLLVVCQQP